MGEFPRLDDNPAMATLQQLLSAFDDLLQPDNHA